jgi:hypothetical protein
MKRTFLKNLLVKAMMLALIGGSLDGAGNLFTQSAYAQTSRLESSGGGPQEGGDGPKKPRPCPTRICRPNTLSVTEINSSASEPELSWWDHFLEWVFG